MAVNSASHILKIVIRVVDQATAGLNKVGTQLTAVEKGMKGFSKASKLDVFNKNLAGAGLKMNKLGNITDMSTKKTISLATAADRVNQSLGRGVAKVRTFDMRLLSLMFGGMALKRLFGGMLRSIVNTFVKAEDNTSGLGKATVRLSASWEFLKFSIMDALNTDFFLGMIDAVINIIDWFSQLGDTAKQALLGIMAGMFLLGAIMMTIGQTKLFTDAVFGGSGFLGGIIKSLGFTGILGMVILIAGVVIILTTKWDELKEVASTLWDDLKVPLTSIKNSLDSIAQTAGFESLFDMIGSAGVRAFTYLGFALLQVAFAVDLIVTGLSNLATQIKALKSGDWETIIKVQAGSFSDGMKILNQWKTANVDYLDAVTSIGDDKKATPDLGSGEFGGVGSSGSWDLVGAEITKTTDSVDKNIDAGKIAMAGYSTSLSEEVIPVVQGLISTISGEDGLLKGLTNQGNEMDLLAGEKTEAHTVSSNTQVENNDRVTSSFRRLIAAASEYQSKSWYDFDALKDIPTSSVDGD